MKANVEATIEEKKRIKVDESRKKKRKVGIKPVKVVGYARGENAIKVDNDAGMGQVFANLIFFIMTDSAAPQKKSKNELEAIIKAHGGRIVQTNTVKDENVYCVADRNTVKVASLRKMGDALIIKPTWIFDCVEQARKDFAKGLPERT
ncbi:MAG: DNA ligase (ATP), partial [Watsoniomyces obsoletus]